MEHIVILGNGIAGITAARHIRKNSDKKITIISAETDHFFSRTALMYVYMGHMRFKDIKPYEDHFWEKNRLELVKAFINKIDFTAKTLHTFNGKTIHYDKLILAVGSVPNKFGWPGQDAMGVQGLYSFQDLQELELVAPNNQECRHAVVVGGGLIGIELAEMLRTRNIPVTFLVREKSFWNSVLPSGESEMINRHIKSHHIDLRLDTNLKEIVTNNYGKATGVILKESGEKIDCDLVGLTAGVRPNIDFLKQSPLETEKGILVNRMLETNIPDVYAIGDCAQQREPIDLRPAVESVWYTGRMMGETVAQTICGNPFAYNPGHWFNSAKFLDIEYQTYGWVFSERKKPEYQEIFHWKHPDDTKCITVAYHRETKEFLGINTFGIRMRHEVFDRWLTEKRDVDFVMKNLRQANFDPEFFRRYEKDVWRSYAEGNKTK